METRKCGRHDLDLSVFGLGTMTFGAESDEEASHQILDHYFEAGGRFIDTANVYSQGASESIIGRWLTPERRDEIILATKARFAMGDGPDQSGSGRKHLTNALDASLRRLGVDVIDLYQLHAWDPESPLEETLETLDGFVRAGKVRFVGVSNFMGWQLERAARLAAQSDWMPIVSLQPQYNLLARDIELEILPSAIENGMGILPWSPLGGGWLTGKYSPDTAPTGETRLGEDPQRGVEAYDLRNTQRTWAVIDTVKSIARRREVVMPQVALNWLAARDGVSSVLLGCRTVEQLESNLGALEWRLGEDELNALTEVSAPGVPSYPHGFMEHHAGMDTWAKMGTRNRPVM